MSLDKRRRNHRGLRATRVVGKGRMMKAYRACNINEQSTTVNGFMACTLLRPHPHTRRGGSRIVICSGSSKIRRQSAEE